MYTAAFCIACNFGNGIYQFEHPSSFANRVLLCTIYYTQINYHFESIVQNSPKWLSLLLLLLLLFLHYYVRVANSEQMNVWTAFLQAYTIHNETYWMELSMLHIYSHVHRLNLKSNSKWPRQCSTHKCQLSASSLLFTLHCCIHHAFDRVLECQLICILVTIVPERESI